MNKKSRFYVSFFVDMGDVKIGCTRHDTGVVVLQIDSLDIYFENREHALRTLDAIKGVIAEVLIND